MISDVAVLRRVLMSRGTALGRLREALLSEFARCSSSKDAAKGSASNVRRLMDSN